MIPTPAPIRATLRRVRARGLSRPNGPSTITAVPGRSAATAALPSPASATVIRRLRPSGADDSEYGFARDQPARPRKRQVKNWPGWTRSACRSRPATYTDTTPSSSRTTEVTRSRCRRFLATRHPEPEDHDRQGRSDPQAPPEDGPRRRGGELTSRPELVRQSQADAEVGVEVQQVPRLVAQAAPSRADARDHDHEQAAGAGHRQQHPGVVGRQLPERRGCVDEAPGGVSPADQRDVREHQVERGEADEAVDTDQPVLTVRRLEHRDARHQHHLGQQQDRGDQPGQPAQGLQTGAPAAQVGESAIGAPPEGDQPQGCRQQG